jgi:hypothetical protein
MNNDTELNVLRRAFAEGKLTLYVGAGLSRDSGLPTWNTLVGTLYYSAVAADWVSRWRPFPNYLFALSEWLLKQSGEPPEVIAGKVETYYDREPNGQANSVFQQEFLRTLYAPWHDQNRGFAVPSGPALRGRNPMLEAVAALCEATNANKGLHAVVTTNYDCLLEKALAGGPGAATFEPIWQGSSLSGASAGADMARKGIYHVHGYLPPAGEPAGSPFDKIVLTEAHYHAAASDPYSWSNLCLISCLSSSTGLIAGMSLTDRNLRRVLYALKQTRLLNPVYLIMKEPKPPILSVCDINSITEKAIEYLNRFEDGGLKQPENVSYDLNEILKGVMGQERDMVNKMLEGLGVTLIWVDDFPEISAFMQKICSAA